MIITINIFSKCAYFFGGIHGIFPFPIIGWIGDFCFVKQILIINQQRGGKAVRDAILLSIGIERFQSCLIIYGGVNTL